MRQNYQTKAPHVKSSPYFLQVRRTNKVRAGTQIQPENPEQLRKHVALEQKVMVPRTYDAPTKGVPNRGWPVHSKALSPRYKFFCVSRQHAGPNKGEFDCQHAGS